MKIILSFIVILLVNIAISVHLYQSEEQTSQTRQAEYVQEFPQLYKGALESFRLNAQNTFDILVKRKDVMDILRQLPEDDLAKVTELHNQLYALLKPEYELLRSDIGIRQLHFHQTDGRSFLRMHRPDKFNDPLFSVRATVFSANTEKRLAEGFEEGRIFNGMRYVFPILENGQHYGSVEISYSMDAIIAWLHRMHPANGFYFMISKEIVDDKVFNTEKFNYRLSQVSEDYVEDIEVSHSLPDEFRPNLADIYNVLDANKLKERNPFLLDLSGIDGKLNVTFMPILNFQQIPVGWMLRFNPKAAYYIDTPLMERLIILAILSLGVWGLMSYFILRQERQTRENLALSKALDEVKTLATIVENAAIEIYIIDPEGNQIIYANEQAMTNLGYNKQQMLSRTLFDICSLDPDLLQQRVRPMKQDHHGLLMFETEFQRKDGEHYSAELRLQPLDYQGQCHYLIMVLDLSSREQLVTELRENSELLISQARQAAMGDMIGLLAHQWRQPIASLEMDINNLILDLELENAQPDKMISHLHLINGKIETISHMIEKYRNHFGQDQYELEVTPVSVVDEVISLMRSSLDYHNIDVQVDNQIEQPCYMHRDLLFQVCLTIMSHSKDLLSNRQIEDPYLHLKLRELQHMIEIKICDNAGRISDQLLRPQLDAPPQTATSRGSGSRLYIAQLIVSKKLQGCIEIQHHEHGSCFIVRFPCSNAHT